MTLDEVGLQIGKSKNRVKQMQEEALARLREEELLSEAHAELCA